MSIVDSLTKILLRPIVWLVNFRVLQHIKIGREAVEAHNLFLVEFLFWGIHFIANRVRLILIAFPGGNQVVEFFQQGLVLNVKRVIGELVVHGGSRLVNLPEVLGCFYGRTILI